MAHAHATTPETFPGDACARGAYSHFDAPLAGDDIGSEVDAALTFSEEGVYLVAAFLGLPGATVLPALRTVVVGPLCSGLEAFPPPECPGAWVAMREGCAAGATRSPTLKPSAAPTAAPSRRPADKADGFGAASAGALAAFVLGFFAVTGGVVATLYVKVRRKPAPKVQADEEVELSGRRPPAPPEDAETRLNQAALVLPAPPEDQGML